MQAPSDTVKGYVGMRKISLGRTEPHGHLRPLLNDEFTFQIGFLDQVRHGMPDRPLRPLLDDGLVFQIRFLGQTRHVMLDSSTHHVKGFTSLQPDRWTACCGLPLTVQGAHAAGFLA